jgi:hypothetical protein
MPILEELMAAWKDGNYINADALESAYKVIEILIERIEALESK